jgi:hypothetical protein
VGVYYLIQCSKGKLKRRALGRQNKLALVLLPILLLSQAAYAITAQSATVAPKASIGSTESPDANAGSAKTEPLQPTSTQSQVPTTPEVVQTQNYDFRISTHEISTATSYLYVTPGGNYSFSATCAQCLS